MSSNAPQRRETTARPVKSSFSFQRASFYAPVDAVNHLHVTALSTGTAWGGLRLETGTAEGWGGEDMMVNGHFVAMNIDPHPLHTEVRDETTSVWTPCTRPPGAFRIHPEGRPFAMRYHGGLIQWAGAIIDGGFLDAVMGGHYELRPALSVADPVLEHLFRAMLAELHSPSASPEVTRSIVRCFVLTLGLRHGLPAEEIAPKSGLGEAQLAAMQGWIKARLETRLSVAGIAAQAGLSAVHFSREFKRATGSTPWDYVVQLRLEHARGLILQGEPLSAIALQCGFFDQAHLTRLFKQRFGCTPAAFARQKVKESVAFFRKTPAKKRY